MKSIWEIESRICEKHAELEFATEWAAKLENMHMIMFMKNYIASIRNELSDTRKEFFEAMKENKE